METMENNRTKIVNKLNYILSIDNTLIVTDASYRFEVNLNEIQSIAMNRKTSSPSNLLATTAGIALLIANYWIHTSLYFHFATVALGILLLVKNTVLAKSRQTVQIKLKKERIDLPISKANVKQAKELVQKVSSRKMYQSL